MHSYNAFSLRFVVDYRELRGGDFCPVHVKRLLRVIRAGIAATAIESIYVSHDSPQIRLIRDERTFPRRASPPRACLESLDSLQTAVPALHVRLIGDFSRFFFFFLFFFFFFSLLSPPSSPLSFSPVGISCGSGIYSREISDRLVCFAIPNSMILNYRLTYFRKLFCRSENNVEVTVRNTGDIFLRTRNIDTCTYREILHRITDKNIRTAHARRPMIIKTRRKIVFITLRLATFISFCSRILRDWAGPARVICITTMRPPIVLNRSRVIPRFNVIEIKEKKKRDLRKTQIYYFVKYKILIAKKKRKNREEKTLTFLISFGCDGNNKMRNKIYRQLANVQNKDTLKVTTAMVAFYYFNTHAGHFGATTWRECGTYARARYPFSRFQSRSNSRHRRISIAPAKRTDATGFREDSPR
ncbi:hypothetical protein PUN28_003227 [Cardiocondyla obscurior]|uniref:Uncharacterized protein n=1 Tax=Cardiocondyla obscurior TaxID=286306 RepID=A0AAW2GJI5_9HYME